MNYYGHETQEEKCDDLFSQKQDMGLVYLYLKNWNNK